MALNGKFIINDAYYSLLSLSDLGTFLVFSGNGAYRNRGACKMISREALVPAGKDWMVDRSQRKLMSKLNAGMRDIYSPFLNGATLRYSECVAL